MLAAATELRDTDPALWRLTPRWIQAIAGRWWKAGWSNNDLRHALAHAPTTGGSREVHRCPAHLLRHPDGWVRHRLSAWCHATGTPMAPPRIWDTTQQHVAADHGHAGAARLPYGATILQPEHLAPTDAERDIARDQLVRRWAREFHDSRNAPPTEAPAQAATRTAQRAQFSAAQAARRGPRTTPPALTDPNPTSQPTSEAPTAYERALAVARAAGNALTPRRTRRTRR